MDFGSIVQLISNTGFPIVCVCAMAWYVKDKDDKHRNDIKEMNANHKAEMDSITAALNNNTIALTKLVAHLEGED